MDEWARKISPWKRRLLHALCNIVGAAALIGSGAYVILGSNKGIGVFAVIVSVILCRVLVVDVVIPLEAADDPPRQ